MTHIAIDLGTTNSLVSYYTEEGPVLIKNDLNSFLTPSVVSFDGKVLLIGETAKARLVSHPQETAALFKRTMGADKTYKLGKKEYNAVDLSALLLRTLKENAEAQLNGKVTDAVISVPAYFNEMQRKAVKTAAAMADLKVSRLINEPTAAALAYGLQDKDEESTFLVFDLGGGTFDVSILEVFDGVMEVKATAGDAYLGGEDFTKAIADHLIEEVTKTTDLLPEQAASYPQLQHLAEQAKLALSQKHEVHLQLDSPPLRIDYVLTREKLEELTAHLKRRLRAPLDRVMYDAKLSPDDLDRVVLVGGATRMPLVRSWVTKILRKFPEATLDPDQVVVMGAAVQAGLVSKNSALDDVVMTDVSAFTLGTEIAQEIGGIIKGGYFQPIIERNSVVPISREHIFTAMVPGQKEVTINVYQGEAPLIDSNLYLGEIDVPIPYNKKEREDVAVRFSYDVSGLLEVDTTVLSTGKKKNLLIKTLAGEISQKEINSRLKELSQYKVHPKDEAENQRLRARIEQCYTMANHDDRQNLMQMLATFDALLEKQNSSDIEAAREQISKNLSAFEAGYVQ
ncbi:Hsp70 family protein [Polycladidibacter stylochi]|uniref:Hsp70 family protein n=1 Tax=Polycladidibacter stylochi TaxID=1807766 RepID=UPI00082C4EBA|nr:Hsp70 family protein [Pseudovibrio stylochi]